MSFCFDNITLDGWNRTFSLLAVGVQLYWQTTKESLDPSN